MKVLISVAVLIAALVGVWQLWEYWDKVSKEKQQAIEEAGKFVDSRSLQGLPSQLEQSLQEAQTRGPESFGQWLERHRPFIQDPRLAAIELDYVVAVTRLKPLEAKRIFADVKARVPESSPLTKRIRAMEKTYE